MMFKKIKIKIVTIASAVIISALGPISVVVPSTFATDDYFRLRDANLVSKKTSLFEIDLVFGMLSTEDLSSANGSFLLGDTNGYARLRSMKPGDKIPSGAVIKNDATTGEFEFTISPDSIDFDAFDTVWTAVYELPFDARAGWYDFSVCVDSATFASGLTIGQHCYSNGFIVNEIPGSSPIAIPGDTRAITVARPYYYYDPNNTLILEVIANENISLEDVTGNFELAELDPGTKHFELKTMEPSELWSLYGTVIKNNINTGEFSAAASPIPIVFNAGDVIWRATYEISDPDYYIPYSFSFILDGTTFDTGASLNSEIYNFGVSLYPDPTYVISVIDGSEVVYTTGSGKKLIFRFDVDPAIVKDVKVDGAVVAPTNYEISKGSTIVAFNSSFVDGLGIGAHTVTLTSMDAGTATANFTVAAAPEPVDPVAPVDPVDPADETITVPDTGGFTGIGGSATAIGVGIFVGIAIFPVVIAVSIERRYNRNKINFDKK